METILIEKLLSNGFGMGRNAEGAITFIAGALPGERVLVSSTRKRKGVLWAENHERLNDSPARADPPCPHFSRCGGCEMLHVARKNELELKLTFLLDSLGRIAKLDPPAIVSHDFSPTLSRIRGKFHVGPPGQVGFVDGQSHRITEIPHCLVIPSAVRDLLPSIARATRAVGFRGDIFFATDEQGERPVLEWSGTFPSTWWRSGSLEIPGTRGLLVREPNGKRSKTFGRPLVALKWNRFQVALEPSRFFQSNPASWPHFFDWVGGYLDRFRPVRPWDAHAGAGFLTSCLNGLEVWASEPEPYARAQLERNLKTEMTGFQLFAGTAEQALRSATFAAHEVDGILLDPPRSGLSRVLSRWLIEHGPPSMLYFSCDIGSLCRDLRMLAESYQVVPPLLAMNLNPGTLRLEVAAIMERVPRTPT